MTAKFHQSLFLIPARGGSKGLPGKNIKYLNGQPLIYYSIQAAKELAASDQVCLSTDSDEIIATAKQFLPEIPFKRPAELATNSAGTEDVILHALEYYHEKGREFTNVILLQPTSPLRTSAHIEEAYRYFNEEVDMVVSVTKCKNNPFYNLFEEKSSHLVKTFPDYHSQRQDIQKDYYQYNGAIYVINTASLLAYGLSNLSRIKKYEMSAADSVDIDNYDDWQYAEYLLQRRETANE